MPVPDRNLKEILDAQKLEKEDKSGTFFKITFRRGDVTGDAGKARFDKIIKLLDGKTTFTEADINYYCDKLCSDMVLNDVDYIKRNPHDFLWTLCHNNKKLDIKPFICDGHITYFNREGLFIAAPKEHFDLTGLNQEGKGFYKTTTITVKDPVVFRYVKGGVQVLAKWGLEADDPALQHEILN
jgi:hypothetical protein